MALGWIIDPGSAQFDLNDLSSTFMVSQSLPMPQPRAQYVSAVDVDGDSLYSQNYGNRQIALTCEVKGSTAGAVETTLGYLHQKVAAINREAVSSRTGVGGALQYTSPSGKAVTFDVCSVSVSPDLSATYFLGNLVTVTLTFDCLPAWRGAEVTSLATHTETTLPALVFTETGITGDLSADGRLVLTEAQGADQWWLTWGIQSRHYDSASTANLFYEAEVLTPQGAGAAIATGPSGASGGGSNNTILAGTLTTNYQSILSTALVSGGSHLTHVGDFRAFARVQASSTNSGTVSVGLQWGIGDFRNPTTNETVSLSGTDGTWRLVDLGIVSVPAVVTGTQRWEGRVLAKSTTVGDGVYVDYLMLVPTLEGYGEASALFTTAAPTAITASDTFKQGASTFAGATMDVGGAWSSAGAATDFTIDTTNHVAQRATASDASPRFGIAGTSVMTGALAQVTVTDSATNSPSDSMGVVLRYTDTNNYFSAFLWLRSGFSTLTTTALVAGTPVQFASVTLPQTSYSGGMVRAAVDANGRIWAGFSLDGGTSFVQTITDQAAELATGGALASGKSGIFDRRSVAGTSTRTYDNFVTYPFVSDAAIFASELAQVRGDSVIRQDTTGSVYAPMSKYEGDFLRIPPAGREGRGVRVIVKACRNDPATGPDSAIDDISAQLIYTPRGLGLPE